MLIVKNISNSTKFNLAKDNIIDSLFHLFSLRLIRFDQNIVHFKIWNSNIEFVVTNFTKTSQRYIESLETDNKIDISHKNFLIYDILCEYRENKSLDILKDNH